MKLSVSLNKMNIGIRSYFWRKIIYVDSIQFDSHLENTTLEPSQSDFYFSGDPSCQKNTSGSRDDIQIFMENQEYHFEETVSIDDKFYQKEKKDGFEKVVKLHR